MLTATIDDLISWKPCPDWTDDRIRKSAGRRKKWTALHVLALTDVPPADRLWVVLRPELIPEPTLHELACRFAEHVLPAFEQEYPNDGRPRAAIAAKRAWLRGEIDNTQLAAARDVAWAAGAAWAAARAAARDAATAAWDAEKKWQLDEVARLLKGREC